MPQLEIFFDYACPYCLKGHRNLEALLSTFDSVSVIWRPCEAHPRPDPYGPHSDLCIQGMFYAQEQGADLWEYHRRMYRAALEDRLDIEDVDTVISCARGLVDEEGLREALASGRYRDHLAESNRYAFQQSGVWAVPAYRMDGRRLDAIENIGVSKEQLAAFLKGR